MYIPFAYSKDECSGNKDVMLEISKEINDKYCNCDMGAAGKQVGYVCPGTCLDYAYENVKVPIALAWEIYGADTDYVFLEENEGSNLGLKQSTISPPSCFLQMGSKSFESNLENEDCFRYFNPTTKTDYEETVEKWSKVYLLIKAIFELMDKVDTKKKKIKIL